MKENHKFKEPGKGPWKNTALLFAIGIAFGIGLGIWLSTKQEVEDATPSQSIEQTPSQMPPRLPDDWTPGGPYTGRITCLFSDGDRLYAGGWHMGAYQWNNRDAWVPFDTGMTGYKDVLTIAKLCDTLLAGTFHGELFAFKDSVWNLIHDFGKGEQGVVRSLHAACPWLLVTTGKGLFKHRDTGKTFKPIYQAHNLVDAGFIKRDPTAVIFGTFGQGVGMCGPKLEPCRMSKTYPGPQFISSIQGSDPHSIIQYVATEGGGLFSTIDGEEWSRRTPWNFQQAHIRSVYADQRQIVASADQYGLLILDFEPPIEWETVPFEKLITAIAFHNGTIWAGTDGLGVFRLEQKDDQKRLAPANKGLLNFPEQIVDQALQASETH